MAQTTVPTGSAMARKVYGAALFAKVVSAPSIIKGLTGPAPKQSDAEAKLKGQTVPDMPIVRVTDLSKSAGETVNVDCYDTISGKPIMGDRNAEGQGEALSSSSQDIKIDNTTKVVDAGGKMAQQRTVNQLRGIAMAQLLGYFPRLHSQQALVHLAGARGTQTGKDWVVPLDTDPDFSEIMVNSITAPTYNRHLVINGNSFTNGGLQLGSIATTDLWTLGHVDELATILSDHNMGLQPVKIADDPAADDEPIKGLLYLTERQWAQIKAAATAANGVSFATATQNAWARKSYGSKHPLFSGECIMWAGILMRKQPKFSIRFAPGTTGVKYVPVANRYLAAQTTADVTIPALSGTYGVDRALLLGAQALAYVFGRNQGSDTGFNWMENLYNFERNMEVAGESMGGMAKLRFTFDDGAGNKEPTDNGVFVIDSAAKL
jgi:N4-gp56 family major capsid protein